MAQLYIGVIGLNGAGKTDLATKLAADLNISRVNGDDFRHFAHDTITYFGNTDFSYPNPKSSQLNPLLDTYRHGMCATLLAAGQSVINDGSGATSEWRKKYLRQFKIDFPDITTALIWADITEPELLKRLGEREKQIGGRWTDMYHDFRKQTFQPPDKHESDLILRYNQHNYDEIKQKLADILA